MSEKHKCGVCGFESGDVSHFCKPCWMELFSKEACHRINTFFDDAESNMLCCVVCFFKALGVPAKEKNPLDDFPENILNSKKSFGFNAVMDRVNAQMAAEKERMKAPGFCDTPEFEQARERAVNKVMAEAALPPGYKIITSETFVKEQFEWLCDDKGLSFADDSKYTFTKLDLDKHGKPEKLYGTREYRRQ
jgi:hypothetical protein